MISICKYTAYKSKHDDTEKIWTKIRTRGCGIKVQIEKGHFPVCTVSKELLTLNNFIH